MASLTTDSLFGNSPQQIPPSHDIFCTKIYAYVRNINLQSWRLHYSFPIGSVAKKTSAKEVLWLINDCHNMPSQDWNIGNINGYNQFSENKKAKIILVAVYPLYPTTVVDFHTPLPMNLKGYLDVQPGCSIWFYCPAYVWLYTRVIKHSYEKWPICRVSYADLPIEHAGFPKLR